MKTISEAIVSIGRKYPELLQERFGKVVSEPFDVLSFFEEMDGIAFRLPVKSQAEADKLIADPSITKHYLARKLKVKYEYLALMVLGVEFLKYLGDSKEAYEGYGILENHFDLIRKIILNKLS